MDQAATDVCEKPQKPEHDKDYNYCPKHKFILGLRFPPRSVCSNATETLKAKSQGEFNDRIARPAHRQKNFLYTAKPCIRREQRWMKSVPFWIDSTSIKQNPRLEKNVNLDVIVVDAGIRSITTAHLLKETGLTAALIERERVASMDTGYTNNKLNEWKLNGFALPGTH